MKNVQHSPENVCSSVRHSASPDEKRRRYLDESMRHQRPFKKARHASQIKNYEFTISRMRERAQYESAHGLSSSRHEENPLSANCEPTSPKTSYEQFIANQQMALQQVQPHRMGSPQNMSEINTLQHQQAELIQSVLSSDGAVLNPSPFVPPDQLVPYPQGHFNVLQWHTNELCKTFLSTSAVNRMVRNLTYRQEDQVNRSYEGAEEPHERVVRTSEDMDQTDVLTARNLYEQMEASSSDECESSDDDSDENRPEEIYGEPGDVKLQICDGSYALHMNQQLALAQIHNLRMQTATANAARATLPDLSNSDDNNAQDFCDDNGCDGKAEVTPECPLDADVKVDKKVYCNSKCVSNLCPCKLPSPDKDAITSETVIKGKVESVVDKNAKTNAKFNTSPIKNITLPIKSDIGYPQA